MTREGKWAILLSLFVLWGGVGQFLFTSAGKGWAWGVGLPLLIGALILFTRLGVSPFPDQPGDERLKPPVRFLWMGLIAVPALFFGLFQLSSMPPGLFIDQGAMGWDALELLKAHHLPPLQLNFLHHPPLAIYGLAAWFSLFPATAFSLQLFFLTLSWAGLILFYLFIQRLCGQRLALLATALLACMRWYFMTARNGFPSVMAPLFALAVILLWLRALRSHKLLDYVFAGLVLGAGFYTYQSLKIIPLLILVLAFYEWLQNRKGFQWGGPALMAGVFLIVSAPILFLWLGQGSLGQRESEIWIGNAITQKKSLAPLLKNFADWALMFNRREVPYPCIGIQGHRLLDDFTSFCFWLGFFFALRNWKQRPYFYLLSSLLVMSLPLFLASDSLNAQRMVGAAPFAAGLAALSLAALLRGAEAKGGKFGRLLVIQLVLGFVVSLYQNYDVYFRQQAGDQVSWRSYMPEATMVGEAAVNHPGVFFKMTNRFREHETVKFLCYGQADRVEPLELASLLGSKNPPNEKLCFALDQGKQPTLDLLKQVYTGGREEDLKDPWGGVLGYLYYWEPGPGRTFHPLEARGLQGRYFMSGDGSGSPVATRWDPILNFTNLGDFPLPGPLFSARWIGVLNAPQTGTYGFFLLTTDHGELRVDGQPVVETIGPGQGEVRLARGSHRIELSDARPQPGEIRADFHLLWKPPGQASFGILPQTAFEMIHTN